MRISKWLIGIAGEGVVRSCGAVEGGLGEEDVLALAGHTEDEFLGGRKHV